MKFLKKNKNKKISKNRLKRKVEKDPSKYIKTFVRMY
jgi:hypothetical protein